MNKAEELIKQIEEADEVEILEFDFEPCFKYLRELEELNKQRSEIAQERHELSDLLLECYKRLKHHDQHIAFHDQTLFMKKLEAVLAV